MTDLILTHQQKAEFIDQTSDSDHLVEWTGSSVVEVYSQETGAMVFRGFRKRQDHWQCRYDAAHFEIDIAS